jgi:hypothetical protein
LPLCTQSALWFEFFVFEARPNCDKEYKAIPDLEKAVKDDMMKQNGREVEVVSEWMSMELFETQFGSFASQFAITFGFSLMWCSTCGCQLYVPGLYAI